MKQPKRACLRVFGVFTLLSLLFVSLAARAADFRLSSYLITQPAERVMRQIADKYEVVRRTALGFEVYVPSEDAAAFFELAPHARLLQADIRSELHNAIQSDPTSFAGYHSFSAIEAHLKEIAAAHPDLAKVQVYGKSQGGRPLYLLKLTQNVARGLTSKPNLLLDAATHGDELITTEALLGILDELVNGYGSNPEITKILNTTTLLIVPVVNPDGFVTHNRYEGRNDPNRSYPYPDEPGRKTTPCIAALIELSSKLPLAGSIDLHAYGKLMMYPWGYTTAEIGDQAKLTELDQLTTLMSEENGYQHGSISSTIYVAKGSSADYYYWKGGTVAIATEIGDSKMPPASEIAEQMNAIRPSIMHFLNHFTH